MDIIDHASDLEERHRAAALAAHRAARAPAPGTAADGLCADCGDPIPAARLARVPGARRCVECQQREERR